MSNFVYCRGCGKQIHATALACPSCGAPQLGVAPQLGAVTHLSGVTRDDARSSAAKSVGFFDAVRICFSKYAVFKGRASRSEYWYFTLFGVMISFTCIILSAMTNNPYTYSDTLGFFDLVRVFYTLIAFLPGLAVLARRLHDTNRSAWCMLIAFIPFIGWIILLAFVCEKGNGRDNKYGPDPLL